MKPTCPPGMRCDIPKLVNYLLRGALISNGCTREDAERVRIEPYTFGGLTPILACVMVNDGIREREVHRVYDLDDLEKFIANPIQIKGLADEVHRIASVGR